MRQRAKPGEPELDTLDPPEPTVDRLGDLEPPSERPHDPNVRSWQTDRQLARARSIQHFRANPVRGGARPG